MIIRRCDNQFKCPQCDEWITTTNHYCKSCRRHYPACEYYNERILTAKEFQKYAKEYNFESMYKHSWCDKYNEPIKETWSNDKFYNKNLTCTERYK